MRLPKELGADFMQCKHRKQRRIILLLPNNTKTYITKTHLETNLHKLLKAMR